MDLHFNVHYCLLDSALRSRIGNDTNAINGKFQFTTRHSWRTVCEGKNRRKKRQTSGNIIFTEKKNQRLHSNAKIFARITRTLFSSVCEIKSRTATAISDHFRRVCSISRDHIDLCRTDCSFTRTRVHHCYCCVGKLTKSSGEGDRRLKKCSEHGQGRRTINQSRVRFCNVG